MGQNRNQVELRHHARRLLENQRDSERHGGDQSGEQSSAERIYC